MIRFIYLWGEMCILSSPVPLFKPSQCEFATVTTAGTTLLIIHCVYTELKIDALLTYIPDPVLLTCTELNYRQSQRISNLSLSSSLLCCVM